MKKQDPSMLYRLMVLYMLRSAQYPLTNADISDYILLKGYTDSITLQIAITDLINSNMIKDEKKHNRTYLELTKDGIDTITSLEDRISGNIKKDIYSYLSINDKRLKEDHAVQTAISASKDGAYIAELNVMEKGTELFSMKLSFPTMALAASACSNFKDESSDLYKYVMERLLK